jgi:hypothetical protein
MTKKVLSRAARQLMHELDELRDKIAAAAEAGDDATVDRLTRSFRRQKVLPKQQPVSTPLKPKKWARVAATRFGSDVAAQATCYVANPNPDEAQLLIPVAEHSGRGAKPLNETEWLARHLTITEAYAKEWRKRRNLTSEAVAAAAAKNIRSRYGIPVGQREIEDYMTSLTPDQRVMLLGEGVAEVVEKLKRYRAGKRPRNRRRRRR